MVGQFTPGPWWAVIDQASQPVPYYRGLIAIVSSSPGLAICTGEHGDTSGSVCHSAEWVPNAHLIAAAPDLYAALEEAAWLLRAICNGGEYPDEREIISQAAAALAKARGWL